MIESGGYRRFDKLIVVHCRPEVQLERLMLRDKLSRDEAQRRIDSQMPQEEKQKFADYLIDTSDGFELTREQTVKVYDLAITIEIISAFSAISACVKLNAEVAEIRRRRAKIRCNVPDSQSFARCFSRCV